MHKITSEIHLERNNFSEILKNGNTISQFFFKCPSYMMRCTDTNKKIEFDDDDDVDVTREKEQILFIECKPSTELQLVGLQVWRGAFLLADYILSNPSLFRQEIIVELGSGVGLTSIIASTLAKEVICTDIAAGGILKLIERNVAKNLVYIKSQFCIQEVDFLNRNWSEHLNEKLNAATIVLAADVIYDNEITEGFINTLVRLLSSKVPKTVYLALEKRYVFTISDLETVAPMYEEFLSSIKRQHIDWNIDYIKIDFPQYFKYNRVNDMVLMKIRSKTNINSLPIVH